MARLRALVSPLRLLPRRRRHWPVSCAVLEARASFPAAALPAPWRHGEAARQPEEAARRPEEAASLAHWLNLPLNSPRRRTSAELDDELNLLDDAVGVALRGLGGSVPPSTSHEGTSRVPRGLLPSERGDHEA